MEQPNPLHQAPPPRALQIVVRCVDAGHVGELWAFQFTEEALLLRDPLNQVVATLTPELAVTAFTLPAGARKTLVLTTGGRRHEFDVGKRELEYLTSFTQLAAISEGPAAVRKLLNAALINLALGTGAIGLATLLLVVQLWHRRIGALKPVLFLVIVGFSMFGKGSYDLNQYRSLRRLMS